MQHPNLRGLVIGSYSSSRAHFDMVLNQSESLVLFLELSYYLFEEARPGIEGEGVCLTPVRDLQYERSFLHLRFVAPEHPVFASDLWQVVGELLQQSKSELLFANLYKMDYKNLRTVYMLEPCSAK